MSKKEHGDKAARNNDEHGQLRAKLVDDILYYGAEVLLPNVLFRQSLRFPLQDEGEYRPWTTRRADGTLAYDISEIKRELWSTHGKVLANMYGIGYVVLTPDRAAEYVLFEYLIDAPLALKRLRVRMEVLEGKGSAKARKALADISGLRQAMKSLRRDYGRNPASDVAYPFDKVEMRRFLANGVREHCVLPNEVAALSKKIEGKTTVRREAVEDESS